MKSVYHVREYEVHKLKRIREPLDVFVSHDWPRGIVNYGDKEGLLRYKPYFRQEVRKLHAYVILVQMRVRDVLTRSERRYKWRSMRAPLTCAGRGGRKSEISTKADLRFKVQPVVQIK